MEWTHLPKTYWRNFSSRVDSPYVVVVGGLVATLFIILLLTVAATAPGAFPKNKAVTIEKGLTASAIADQLKAERVVRSSTFLYLLIVLFHDPHSIKAGSYVFHEPNSVFDIAKRITDDTPLLEYVSLTFYEGMSVERYATLAAKHLIDFDSDYFVTEGLQFEGFLFPETYHVPYEYTAAELLELLRKTYTEKATPLLERNSTTLTEREIIILASLIEREGNGEENMRMIAGILLNRLKIDMPLQVDISIEYILNKPIDQLTAADLEIDSPYNTYLYRGLPPTPIGNPGLQAIQAVLSPTESEYLYYITGQDGEFYYAKTYDEHLDNIARYLK